MVPTPYVVVVDGDDTYQTFDIDDRRTHTRNHDEVTEARMKGRNSIPRMNRFGNWATSRTFKSFFWSEGIAK